MKMRSRNRIALVAAAALALRCAAARAEIPPERMYRTVVIADGIYAFISPETSGPIPSGNVVAVIGDGGVLVVDSGRFPALARRIVAEIRAKTGQPVRYLVHTHWHLDHVTGDGEFRAAFPDMIILATDFTRRKMIEKQVPYLKDIQKNDLAYVQDIEALLQREKALPEEKRRYLLQEVADIRMEAAELAGARIVEPDLTFDREITVHLGRRDVRIAFLGQGNTEGDTVVFVPDSKVVVTGDLLVSPVPYAYGCHPAAWVATLKTLIASDAATIVPGHGSVMHDWEYAKRVMAVLEAIRAQVGEAVRQGASLDDVRKRVDLARFEKDFAGDDFGRAKAFRDFFVLSAIERAYQEAHGTMAEE
jgi:glyoxylase-like metal-dependent hydrolase (beta-lactamase superfamily II)